MSRRLNSDRAVRRSPWSVPDARVPHWPDQGRAAGEGARPTRLSASGLSSVTRDTSLVLLCYKCDCLSKLQEGDALM